MSTKKALLLITFAVTLLTVAVLLVIYVAFDAPNDCVGATGWERQVRGC